MVGVALPAGDNVDIIVGEDVPITVYARGKPRGDQISYQEIAAAAPVGETGVVWQGSLPTGVTIDSTVVNRSKLNFAARDDNPDDNWIGFVLVARQIDSGGVVHTQGPIYIPLGAYGNHTLLLSGAGESLKLVYEVSTTALMESIWLEVASGPVDNHTRVLLYKWVDSADESIGHDDLDTEVDQLEAADTAITARIDSLSAIVTSLQARVAGGASGGGSSPSGGTTTPALTNADVNQLIESYLAAHPQGGGGIEVPDVVDLAELNRVTGNFARATQGFSGYSANDLLWRRGNRWGVLGTLGRVADFLGSRYRPVGLFDYDTTAQTITLNQSMLFELLIGKGFIERRDVETLYDSSTLLATATILIENRQAQQIATGVPTTGWIHLTVIGGEGDRTNTRTIDIGDIPVGTVATDISGAGYQWPNIFDSDGLLYVARTTAGGLLIQSSISARVNRRISVDAIEPVEIARGDFRVSGSHVTFTARSGDTERLVTLTLPTTTHAEPPGEYFNDTVTLVANTWTFDASAKSVASSGDFTFSVGGTLLDTINDESLLAKTAVTAGVVDTNDQTKFLSFTRGGVTWYLGHDADNNLGVAASVAASYEILARSVPIPAVRAATVDPLVGALLSKHADVTYDTPNDRFTFAWSLGSLSATLQATIADKADTDDLERAAVTAQSLNSAQQTAFRQRIGAASAATSDPDEFDTFEEFLGSHDVNNNNGTPFHDTGLDFPLAAKSFYFVNDQDGESWDTASNTRRYITRAELFGLANAVAGNPFATQAYLRVVMRAPANANSPDPAFRDDDDEIFYVGHAGTRILDTKDDLDPYTTRYYVRGDIIKPFADERLNIKIKAADIAYDSTLTAADDGDLRVATPFTGEIFTTSLKTALETLRNHPVIDGVAFTQDDANKLAGIDEGAQRNVNPDLTQVPTADQGATVRKDALVVENVPRKDLILNLVLDGGQRRYSDGVGSVISTLTDSDDARSTNLKAVEFNVTTRVIKMYTVAPTSGGIAAWDGAIFNNVVLSNPTYDFTRIPWDTQDTNDYRVLTFGALDTHHVPTDWTKVGVNLIDSNGAEGSKYLVGNPEVAVRIQSIEASARPTPVDALHDNPQFGELIIPNADIVVDNFAAVLVGQGTGTIGYSMPDDIGALSPTDATTANILAAYVVASDYTVVNYRDKFVFVRSGTSAWAPTRVNIDGVDFVLTQVGATNDFVSDGNGPVWEVGEHYAIRLYQGTTALLGTTTLLQGQPYIWAGVDGGGWKTTAALWTREELLALTYTWSHIDNNERIPYEKLQGTEQGTYVSDNDGNVTISPAPADRPRGWPLNIDDILFINDGTNWNPQAREVDVVFKGDETFPAKKIAAANESDDARIQVEVASGGDRDDQPLRFPAFNNPIQRASALNPNPTKTTGFSVSATTPPGYRRVTYYPPESASTQFAGRITFTPIGNLDFDAIQVPMYVQGENADDATTYALSKSRGLYVTAPIAAKYRPIALDATTRPPQPDKALRVNPQNASTDGGHFQYYTDEAFDAKYYTAALMGALAKPRLYWYATAGNFALWRANTSNIWNVHQASGAGANMFTRDSLPNNCLLVVRFKEGTRTAVCSSIPFYSSDFKALPNLAATNTGAIMGLELFRGDSDHRSDQNCYRFNFEGDTFIYLGWYNDRFAIRVDHHERWADTSVAQLMILGG